MANKTIDQNKVTSTKPPPAVKDSVYFYTFHKCASSLFSNFILKNVSGLEHIDYEGKLYRNEEVADISYAEKGYIYGPIRLFINPRAPIYRRIIKPVSSLDFVCNKKAVFMVRDPRDIIVSEYYSFGFSHGASKSDTIRKGQESKRKEIQSMSIDAYALKEAKERLGRFELIDSLANTCEQGVVLRFEDMVTDWDGFSSALTKYLDLSPAVLEQVYQKSRPRKNIIDGNHRRSGKTEQFRTELQAETIDYLNLLFVDVLKRFGYSA